MKRKILLLGVDTNISPESYGMLKEALQNDFPEHEIRLVVGLRYAAEFTPLAASTVKGSAHADGAYL